MMQKEVKIVLKISFVIILYLSSPDFYLDFCRLGQSYLIPELLMDRIEMIFTPKKILQEDGQFILY